MIGGVELRKQRNLGDIVSDAFNILFSVWKPMAMIVLPIVVFSIAQQLVLYAIDDDIGDPQGFTERLQRELDEEERNPDGEVDFELDVNPLSVIVTLAGLPITIILFLLCGAAGVFYLDKLDKGEQIQPAEALDEAQGKLGPLLGATFRSWAILFLLSITIVGIPFAIYRGVRWIFISQVVMLEGIRGPDVLARSAELLDKQWWNTVGRLIVTGLVIWIPAAIFQEALLAAFPGVIGIITSSSIQLVSAPFGIIATSLMYLDRFVRKAPLRNDDDAGLHPA